MARPICLMEPIEIIPEKKVTKQIKGTVKPRKILNLNSLDKVTVYRICKNTKSRDVTNLCKEYSLNNVRDVKRKIQNKRKHYVKKEKKHFRRKKAKHPPKKKTKNKKHLFFESNSFRRRKSEESESLLDQLAGSVTRLLWPGGRRRRRRRDTTS